MNERSIQGLLGTIIVAFLLGGIVGWLLKPCPGTPDPIVLHETEVVIDTVWRVITQDPIYVEGPARVVTRTEHDTIIQTRPFTATLDTVLNRDTLNVGFKYPESTFSVLLRQAPDSVQLQYETKTIYITKNHVIKREWWMDALTHFGAATIGYGVGRLQ